MPALLQQKNLQAMKTAYKPLRNLIFTKSCKKALKLSVWNSILTRDVSQGKISSSPRLSFVALGHCVQSSPFSTVAEEQYELNSPSSKGTFVYTDYSKIEDERKQGFYLTKSILKSGLPSIHDRPLNLDQTLLDSIYKEFEDHLLDSFLFCYGEEELFRKKFSVVNTFLNMTQTTWRKTTTR